MPGAIALREDRKPILRQQAAHHQATTCQRVSAGEDHVRIKQLRRCVLGEGDAGGKTAQGRRLHHVRHRDGDGHGRAVQRSVGAGDGDVIDIVGARICRGLEVRRHLEADRARAADVEQRRIRAAERKAERGAFGVGASRLVGGAGAVLGEAGGGAGGDAGRFVRVRHRDGDGPCRAGLRAIGGDDGDVVDVVAIGIGRSFEIRRDLEGDRAGAADVEPRRIRAAERVAERVAFGVGAGRLVDGAGGVLGLAGDGAGGNAGCVVLCRDRHGDLGERSALTPGKQRAVEFARDQVEQAIVIQVHEGGRACYPNIDAVVRIGGAGQRGEDRCCAGAGITPRQYPSIGFSQNEVGKAVAVQVLERGGAAVTRIDAIEGIGGAGEGSKDRRRVGTGIAPRQQRAIALARDEVEQAVAVQIHEGRRAELTHIDAVEGIGGAGQPGEGGSRNGTGVTPRLQRASFFARDEVEQAIAVQVHEHRLAAVANIETVERIGSAGQGGEYRRGAGALVAPRQQRAVPIARDEVEQAIAVKIHEGGRGGVANINAVERIGGTGQRRKSATAAKAGAGPLDDVDRQVARGGRRVAGIGIGQALDQRIHRCRCDIAVEGHGEGGGRGQAGVAAIAGGAKGDAAIADGAAGDADLPGAVAFR